MRPNPTGEGDVFIPALRLASVVAIVVGVVLTLAILAGVNIPRPYNTLPLFTFVSGGLFLILTRKEG